MYNYQMSWPEGAKAALTLCFDDGFKQTYELIRDLLLKYDMKATFFVPIFYIGKSLYGFPVMTWEELMECARQSNEIGSHTIHHVECAALSLNDFYRFLKNLCTEDSKLDYIKYVLTSKPKSLIANIEPEKVASEIIHSKVILEKKLHLKVSSFAYPSGIFNSKVKEIVRKAGYLNARTTLNGLNIRGKIDFYELKGLVWKNYTKVSFMNRWVDRALEKHGWLIEIIHLVTTKNLSMPDAILKNDLEKHLEYIAGKKVYIDTQREICKIIRSTNRNQY